MIVTSRASTDYAVMLKKHKKLPSGFYKLQYYQRGRDALIAALMLLKLTRGDTIAVPAYVCNSVVETLRQGGYNLVFIDVELDLTLDPAKVADLAERHGFKVLLVIHYFGLPVNIENIAKTLRRRDVLIIEDCCHSFLSHVCSEKINLIGDAAIFSIRKTLPVPDGGALYLKSKVYKNKILDQRLNLDPVVWPFLMRNILESAISFVGWPNIYSSSVSKLKKYMRKRSKTTGSAYKNNMIASPQKPSWLLEGYMSNNSYFQKLSKQTRKNYVNLGCGALSIGLRPYSTELPEVCVPQWMPVYDLSIEAVEWMRQHGVGVQLWPWEELPDEVAMGHRLYPVANYLNSTLALLPVHHEIGDIQIARVLHLLKLFKDKDGLNLNRMSRS